MRLTRRSFLSAGAAAGMGVAVSRGTARADAIERQPAARMQLIRHATSLLHYSGRVLLVDPMLGDPGAMPAIANSPNPRPNPLVPLPVAAEKVLDGVDAILVTHTHADHWDAAATRLVPKDTTLFVQPADSAKFEAWGFSRIRPIETSTSWNGITITRTAGRHGRGDVGRRMAPVSGFVLSGSAAPTIYIAGDTVWCPEVAEALQSKKPDLVVLNAGAAQFLEGGPITMDADDVGRVCQAAPEAEVIAVHMEAINHCVLTRPALGAALDRSKVRSRVLIPRDGEELRWP